MPYAHPRVTAGYPPWPPEAQPARTSAHRAARFDGIDLLRGLVMALAEVLRQIPTYLVAAGDTGLRGSAAYPLHL